MKKKIFIGILSIIFISILILVLLNKIDNIDNLIYQRIYSLRSDLWDTIFKTITRFGNTLNVLCITIIIFLLVDRKTQRLLGINIMVTVFLNQFVKQIIRKPRPDHIRLIHQGGYSFPSGHAMISIALYGFLIYLLITKPCNKYLKVFGIPILILLIIGIGCSRIYLGVHYPSDILAGYSLSLIILILVIHYKDKMNWGNNHDKNGSK